MDPYVDKCPICQKEFSNRAEERRHAHSHLERKTKSVHIRMQPSQHQSLERVARAYNMNATEAIRHAIKETWNI